MISVLVPSRGRPELLKRSVNSLRATADNEGLQVVVAADGDDPDTILMAADLGVDCVVTSRFGYEGLHKYYQKAADMATGNWLLVWNDDATMLTQGWDQEIEALPLNILVADIQTPHSPLCCYPAIRRSVVKAYGRFSSDNPHVDTFWQDVGHATGSIYAVPVHADLESPVKPGQTHGYYDAPHQAELATAIAVIRREMRALSNPDPHHPAQA